MRALETRRKRVQVAHSPSLYRHHLHRPKHLCAFLKLWDLGHGEHSLIIEVNIIPPSYYQYIDNLQRRTHQIASDNDPKPRRRAKSIKPTERSGENEQDAAPPQKRRRVAGSLSLIMTMPIEVFCEVSAISGLQMQYDRCSAKIASYSSPEVLLPMARASKALRSLLISKSSKLIWVAAERAIGIPPCPPDLSCPQYASLIFDKFCMVSNNLLYRKLPSCMPSVELPRKPRERCEYLH